MLAVAASVRAQSGEPAPPDSTELEALPYLDTDNPRQYIIKDVVVHGTEFQNPEWLVSMSGLVRGDTIWMPGELLADVTRRFWNLQQYSDVKTVVQTRVDSAWIHIYLTELPLVSSWEFDGAKRSETEDLLEKLNIRRNLPLTDFRVKTYTDLIREYYEGKAYRNVRIELDVRTDTEADNSITATFRIDKGAKVKIGEISFTGNDTFRAGRLRRTLKKTHRRGINIFQSSKFDEKLYEEDQTYLIDFYNSKGFRDAIIVSDSIYPIGENRMGIRMNLSEGTTFYYRNVTWMGNSVYPTEYLNELLGIRKGDMYDRRSMDRGLGIRNEADGMRTSVSTLYQNNGYLASNIEAQEVVVGRDSIDLQIKILEGKPFTVNQITIAGNQRVFDHAIRRELEVRPGDLYNQQMLLATVQRLGQMTHFAPESVYPRPIQIPGSDDQVDLAFQLEEVPSDQFDVSGGWGAGMFVGSVGVTLTNFNMGDIFKKGAWRPYPHGENQQLSIRGQSNGQYYKGLSLTFTDPWFGGKKPNSLTLGLYYSDQTDAMWVYQRSNRHFRTMGASIGVGRRLRWPDHMFSLYNEVMYQAYNLKEWQGFLGFANGTANILALNTTVSRNTVSNPYFPSDGSTLSLSVSLTPPYSLWDGRDYSRPMPEQDRNRWIEYHKWGLSGDWYLPLNEKQTFALRLHAEMGMVGSYNKHKQSPFEGYEVGGDGMSGYNLYGVDVVGLRGYENGALTNTTSSYNQSKAYNKYIAELRFLALDQGQTKGYILAFLEGGNAFSHVRNFDPFLLKRSAGVGVRLHLPMVGWIGIDYGYGFDRDASGKKGGSNPHFIIGQNF